jgi:hypothetical protein
MCRLRAVGPSDFFDQGQSPITVYLCPWPLGPVIPPGHCGLCLARGVARFSRGCAHGQSGELLNLGGLERHTTHASAALRAPGYARPIMPPDGCSSSVSSYGLVAAAMR